MQDFKEFIQLLNSEKIKYLLIGGYAVAIHGFVRTTKDMDIWIATDAENIDRMVRALIRFGFAASGISNELFAGPHTVFRMGIPPNRLEILTEISGVEFADCYTRRINVQIDGVPVSLISYDDLKRNKTASKRLHDLADVEQLEKVRLRQRK
jgi:hypothetical protein